VTDPILSLLAGAAILAAPGPTNTLLATSGASVGISRSWRLLLAAVVGYVIAIIAIRVALAPLLAAYPAIGITLRIAVALYLVWIAIKLWRQPLVLDADARSITFTNVFVTTLLNPKALIFALTILPQENAPTLLWYVAVFVATVVVTGGGWIVLGCLLKGAAGARANLIPKVAAGALVGFAGFILRAAI
jgi:threonine/homoserine/homoserine lactone efflux protein